MPNTNYLNNLADEPVVIRINDDAAPFDNGQVETGWHSGLTTGKFAGKNSSANVVEADAAAAVQIPALGVLTYDARNSYSVAGKTGNKDYNFVDMYHDSIVVKLGTGLTLTPGQPIWLSSGGGITQTHPAVIGNIRQQLGFAISTTEFSVHVCDAETMGI